MPLPKLNDLTPEQQDRLGEAHEAYLRGDAFAQAIRLLQEADFGPDPEYFRGVWEQHVIPVLRGEHDKADAEHLRILRELGYEGR